MTIALSTPAIAGAREQLSTRLIFFIVGMAMAAWAPLVPLAKIRLGIDDGTLGLLLLFLGLGSIVAMPITGIITTRIGCRRAISSAIVVTLACLPLLATLNNLWAMAATLAVFGASIGTVDVAMNIHAVIVERDSGKPMMSGFHGLFSVGGIFGAAGVSALLGTGMVSPLVAALSVGLASLLLFIPTYTGLLTHAGEGTEQATPFVMPKGSILFIGVLCFLCFLLEGAMLDWSAVFLIGERQAEIGFAGLGYAAFAIAMTIGRLTGDNIRAMLGEQRVMIIGGVLAAAGVLIIVLVPNAYINLVGFLLVGAGASNIVPVLFSVAGRTKAMPAALAITSVTTLGYLGILAGPAAIGFVAHLTDLRIAFLLVALGSLVIAASYKVAAPKP